MNTSQNKSKVGITSVEKNKGIITSPKIMSTTNLDHPFTSGMNIMKPKKFTSKSPENKINDFKRSHIDGTNSLVTKTIDIGVGSGTKKIDKKESPRVVGPGGTKIPALKIKGFYEIAKLTAINTGSNSARIMYKSDSKNKKIKK
jgi:hypothetical protein